MKNKTLVALFSIIFIVCVTSAAHSEGVPLDSASDEPTPVLVAQTITFNPVINRSIGAGNFAPDISTSSGLIAALHASPATVCIATDGVVKMVGAGECTLTASQPGSALFLPAVSAARVFTVAALPTGSISGYLFDDLNKNGERDDGEPGVPSVVVQARFPDGSVVGADALTDVDGYYQFTHVGKGTYISFSIEQQGTLVWGQAGSFAGGDSVTLETDGTTITQANFGGTRRGKVAGTIITKKPNESTEQAATSLAGWTITATPVTRTDGGVAPFDESAPVANDSQRTVKTITSTTSGYEFFFEDIDVGLWRISYAPPSGWQGTNNNAPFILNVELGTSFETKPVVVEESSGAGIDGSSSSNGSGTSGGGGSSGSGSSSGGGGYFGTVLTLPGVKQVEGSVGGSGATSTSSAQSSATTYKGQVLGVSKFKFAFNMRQGSRLSPDVIELQKRLMSEGFLDIPATTGYFGPRTYAAARAYQRAHSIIDTGYVAELTRAALNASL